MLSKKVILTGSFGVGKTSLFNQFIHHVFSDKYLTTIGVKVNKKTINVNGRELTILLWDIAGEVLQDKVPVSYFQGANGIIYVFDLSRPSTRMNMEEDLAYLEKLSPKSVIKVVANKKDMVTSEELSKTLSELPRPCDIVTSARTGENVEELFQMMGQLLIEQK